MDILDRLLTCIEKALGPEVFTEELAETIERQFRNDYGATSHWIASLHAYEVQQRQHQVKQLIATGLGNREIAERLGISRQQVWNIRQTM